MTLHDVVWFLFAEGHAADLILVIMMVEAGWLVGGRKWRVGDTALLLLPGALLIVALRIALTGGGVGTIAIVLALSLPLHLADVRRRDVARRR